MSNPHSFWKIAGTISLAALPMLSSGCRSMSTGSWGMPSFSSWNPWKASNSELAQSKPSNQVPTPPSSMMAGSGMARPATLGYGTPGAPNAYTSNATAPGLNQGLMNGGQANPAMQQPQRPMNSYAANPYAAPPTGAAPTGAPNDYQTRQTSATQGENGYYTGPYGMGGNTGAAAPATAPQANPYAANPYANTGAATADRRSGVSYGAGNTGAPNTGAATPSYGTYPQTNPGYPAQPASGGMPAYNTGSQLTNPNTGAPAATPTWNTQPKNIVANTPSESNGLRTAPVTPTSTVTAAPAVPNTLPTESYRPGSTGRTAPSSDVQKASFDNANNQPAAPAAGPNVNYPSTGTPAPNYDSVYR